MEPHTGLNNLDFIVLGIILLSGVLALMRGFIREVLSLLVWVGAYFVAAHYYPIAEPYARQYIKSPSLALDVAAVAVFVVAFILLSLLSYIATRFIKGDALTAIDRSLGFLFGLFRGALVVCLIYLIAVSVMWPDIDKADSQPPAIDQQQQQTANPAPNNVPPIEKPKKGAAPDWLMQARTRPFMALGAEWLKQFAPEKKLEATTADLLEKKSEAKHELNKQILDNLAIPGITGNRSEEKAKP